MKTVAGSILAGFSILGQVIHAWSQHFFYAFYQMGKGMVLEGGGSFSNLPMYNDGITTIFFCTRLLLWIGIVFGFYLIFTGLSEETARVTKRTKHKK